MKNHYKEEDNAPEFWIEQQQNFPILSKAALQIHMAFPTSWECEGFSQISIIKTEHINKLHLEPDARIAISITEPDI